MRSKLMIPFHRILCGMMLLAVVFTANPSSVHAEGQTADASLISDSLFLYASTVLDFDTQGFLDLQKGPLKGYSEELDGHVWTAAEIIAYNAMFYGINPQIILVLLEAPSGLLTQADAQIPRRTAEADANARTFYSHVGWLAETASTAYYARRYHENDTGINFNSGGSLPVLQDLNAGTYGLQTALAKLLPVKRWTNWVTGTRPKFRQVFASWFGDPMSDPDAADVSAAALPANFILPFPVGQKWYYTGGPHTYTGSGARPWSSIDIAPPEATPCPVGSKAYNADRWIVAAQGGNVIKSQQALVVIDHGNGWRTYYSHVATTDRRPTGPIKQGERVGHPSCEVEPTGKTTGIHVHLGIWLQGAGFQNIAGSSFSDWEIQEAAHYKGTMTRSGVTRTSKPGRIAGTNDIVNSGVGFNSQFAANAKGWTPLKAIWDVSPTGYYHTPGVADSFVSAMHNNFNATLTYTVRMKVNGCTNCGNYIYFRGTPNPLTPSGTWNNAYVFEYSNNGYFIIGKQAGGLWSSFMSDWEYSPFISSGWNTLKVTANGGFVQFFINGFRLKTFLLSDFSVGRVGIGFWQSALNMNHLYVDWATLSPFAPSTAASGDEVLDTVEYPEIMPDPRMSP